MTGDGFVFVPEYGFSVTERKTVWEDPSFKAEIHRTRLETGDEMAFFHLEVVDLTPGTLKRMLRAWKDHRGTLPDPLFTCADEDTVALDRLRELFGFEFIVTMPCTDGHHRKLFVHRAK